APRRRGRRGPARWRRGGWTCRRRFRPSARTDPRRRSDRAGRSGRCRGSKAGRAWTVRVFPAARWHGRRRIRQRPRPQRLIANGGGTEGRSAGDAAEGAADPRTRVLARRQTLALDQRVAVLVPLAV